MAVIASASITLTSITDVASTTRYYKLQSSTLAKPAKPTAKPPSGWTTTEPTYAAVATSSLYTCDLTVFSDGTYAYSDVSLSSSYEAAKDAYNQAIEAAKTASNYMEYTSAGLDVGNKISGVWSGLRSRMAAGAFQVLNAAGTVLSSFGADLVEIGKNSASAVIRFCAGKLDMGYNSANGGYSYVSAPGSITVHSKNGGAVSLGIEKDGIMTDWGVGVNSSGIARVVGKEVQLDGKLAVNGVAFAPLAADSGWKWLKGPYGTDKRGVKYRLKGGVVYIVADLDGDSNITVTDGGTSLGTLPAGYRPASTILAACTGKGNNLGQLRVTSAGVVTAWLFGSNSVYFASSLTYPVG